MARPSAVIFSAALLAVSAGAAAQDDAAPARTPEELHRLQGEIADAQRRQAEDQARRDAYGAELLSLQTEAAEAAASIQSLERDLSHAERRIVELASKEAELTHSLDTRRGRISPLLGALQRLRRNPPPALAVTPEDATAAARSAMLIAAIARKLEAEAAQLAQELTRLGETHAALAVEREGVVARSRELDERRVALTGLIARRQEAIAALDADVAAASERIASLRIRTEGMAELMAWVEAETAKAPSPAAESAAGPVTVAAGRVRASFAATRGRLPWPAAGVVSARFGDPDVNGAKTEGVTVRTRGEAQVTAPSDGEIVFAGPFAGYGRLLILSPGEDYFVLIGGFGRLDAVVGQHVLAGEPLGAIAPSGPGGDATMYIELRRKGAPIDPLEWFVPIEASG